MCQAMASPSRSGSGPRKISGMPAAAFFNSWMTLAFPRMVTYLGCKFVLQVHPQLIFGQVLDVPFAGDHLDVGAQVFLQGLRLGGRFHDEQ